ncbi:MAG: hypothetical protein H6619_00625 [Deltaproteobacteria bacterium]|nr:hypothetical protein [Deltaproteobacteria bacterium]
MKNKIYKFLFIILVASNAQAIMYSEELQLKSAPAKQWVTIYQNGEAYSVDAEAELVKDSQYRIKANLQNYPGEIMVASIVELANGELYSSPLHNPYENELEKESDSLARKKIPEIKQQIAEANYELDRLHGEMHIANLKLREKYGLDEVDLIYEKIRYLEAQIQAMQDAQSSN